MVGTAGTADAAGEMDAAGSTDVAACVAGADAARVGELAAVEPPRGARVRGGMKGRARASDVARITPCEYEADAGRLAECDLIIEVVAEILPIKKKVFGWVAANRKPGSIVSSNTSGIPIAAMTDGFSDELKQHFLVTHFFNPVRYMRLLELVAGPDTSKDVVATWHAFGEQVLGKGIVYGKDTPAFIANRIGTFGITSIFRHMVAGGFTVEQVDMIWGKPTGRPASAVFRTADLVGLDTSVSILDALYDEFRDPNFAPVPRLRRMVTAGHLGRKSGQGFFDYRK
jgi:3-hydroxyacyl-CoA dehydrogenase